MALHIRPATIKSANVLVKKWHRHHKPTQGGLFAISVFNDNGLCGAVIVGRPVARMLQDGETAEVTRCVVCFWIKVQLLSLPISPPAVTTVQGR